MIKQIEIKRKISKLLAITLLFSLTFSLSISFAALPAPHVNLFQTKSIQYVVNGKPFTWDTAKYGNYIIGGYNISLVPIKPFADALGFKYEQQKIKGKSYIKVWFSEYANVIYFPVLKEMNDSGYNMALIKNGKIFISVNGLDESVYHVRNNIDYSGATKVVKSYKIDIKKEASFKDLSKFYAYANKDQLLFETNQVSESISVKIVKPYTDGDSGLIAFEELGSVTNNLDGLTFKYVTGTDQATVDRTKAIKEFVKLLLGSTTAQIEEEYLKYYTNVPISDDEMQNYIVLAKESNPYFYHNGVLLSHTGNLGYLPILRSDVAPIAGREKTKNIGTIIKTSESLLKAQVDHFVSNDKKLMAMFEAHLAKYPNLIHVPYHIRYNNKKYDFDKIGTPKEEGAPRMLTVREMGVYFTQKVEDVEWVDDRSIFDLRRDGSVWGSYTYITSKDAVGISISPTRKNYDELAAQLIEYTTGNKNDAAEIFKLRDEVYMDYLNYRLTPKGKASDGKDYTGYHFPQTNKPYKLKSGTVIYLDLNGWYAPSDGTTVYIKKDLSYLRAPYAPGMPYEENMFPMGFVDSKINTWVEPEHFTWGKYK